MSGPDLRFLAERATRLDDHTHERLDEVHARIAVAHQRRSIGVAAGAAALVVALIVGLALVQRGRDVDSPGPVQKPTPTATVDVGAAAVPPPPTGTCWAVASELIAAGQITYDDSRQVPCTQPHTTETVSTFTLTEPTAKEAEPTGGTCGGIVGGYLNIDNESWIDADAFLFLPSKQQVADGASWVRCDVLIPGPWWTPVSLAPRLPVTMTSSVKDAADKPTNDLWTCLGQSPTQDQPKVPCDRPHAYEATGTLAGLGALSAYPSATELQAEAQADCRPAVPRRLAGASVTAAWDGREEFYQGLIRGVCFMYHEDGTLLPPR